MENVLQIAVSKLVEEKLNNAYKEITSDTNSLFKCSTIYDFDYSEFKQVDELGNVILNEHNFHERYIPVFVENIIGEREPLPNCFVSSIVVPISMVVNLDTIPLVFQVISQFTTNCIGKVYDLDYQEQGLPFKIAFMPNIPDFSDFQIVEGETNKIGEITLDAVVSSNLNYGNQILYDLSMDGGNTWENIVKIQPQTTRVYGLHQDQVIGKGYTQASIQTSTWGKEFSMYGYQNSNIAKFLILTTDFGENVAKEYFGFDPNWKFRLTYNDLNLPKLVGNQILKNVKVVFENDLSGSLEIITQDREDNINFYYLDENEKIVCSAIKIEYNNGDYIVKYKKTNNTYIVVYEDNAWVDDIYKEIITLEKVSSTSSNLLVLLSQSNLQNVPLVLEKDVLVTDLSYSDNIGDFISLSFSLVDKL